MERLIDPLVADLQIECRVAVQRGLVWKSRWVRIALGVAGCGAYFAYDDTVFSGAEIGLQPLPAFAVAWLPNIVFAIVSVMLKTVSVRSQG